MNALEMKEKLKNLKAEAKNLLNENKVKEAEAKTLEAKILNAQIEIQEKLDKANEEINNFKNQIKEKDEKINELTTNLDALTKEKEELMDKYTESTNKITELNDKVNKMQPIVDDYNKKEYERKLNEAKDEYKNKFEKVDGLETYETEEIQNLIKDTISEDKTVSNNAKYNLSEKIMELFDKQNNSNINVSNVQETLKDNVNLNPEVDDFEETYGFKKE